MTAKYAEMHIVFQSGNIQTNNLFLRAVMTSEARGDAPGERLGAADGEGVWSIPCAVTTACQHSAVRRLSTGHSKSYRPPTRGVVTRRSRRDMWTV